MKTKITSADLVKLGLKVDNCIYLTYQRRPMMQQTRNRFRALRALYVWVNSELDAAAGAIAQGVVADANLYGRRLDEAGRALLQLDAKIAGEIREAASKLRAVRA